MLPSEVPVADGEWEFPNIRTVLFFVYRAAWLVLFAAAMASTLYFSVRSEIRQQAQYEAGASLGFSRYRTVSVEGQLGSALGEEGRRLGFRGSDLLLAVDGQPLSADAVAQTRLLSGPDGSIASLTLRRSTGELASLRVSRDHQRLTRAYAGTGLTLKSRRWTQFLFEDGANLLQLTAAALLFIRRQRDIVPQLLSFAIVLTCLNTVYVADYLSGLSRLVPSELEFTRAVLFTLAILLFPDGRLRTPWQWLAFLFALATDVWWLVESFSSSLRMDLDTALDVVRGVAIMLALVMRYRATPVGLIRQQMKFVLFGFVASQLLTIVASILVWTELQPMSFAYSAWLTLASHLTESLIGVSLVAGLFVSVQRFRLYDAESTISRSVVVGALTLFLLAIFAGSEKVIEILGERYFGEHLGALAGGLGAAIAAIMVAPLHHRVTHWAEHRFQGDLVHLRTALPILVGDMRESATPERLADAILSRVENGVRATRGAIVTRHQLLHARDVDATEVEAWLTSWAEPDDGKCRLYAERDDPLFPLRLPLQSEGAENVGWLLLGPRPDGSFYGKDERETLLALADPIARALVIARERERSASIVAEQLSAMRCWLDEVRTSLEDLRVRLAPGGPAPV